MRYRRATTLDEAIAMLAEGGVPLAGGTVIVPEAMHAGGGPDVVDISRIAGLREIAFHDSATHLGALVTIARVAAEDVRARHPALHAAAEEVANPHVRRMGTVGGNLGYRKPYPNLPPALIALDATVSLVGAGGERTCTMEELAAEGVPAGAMITGVTVPHDGARSAFRKFAWRRSSGRTLVTVAAGARLAGALPLARPRIAIGGICRRAMRLPAIEDRLAAEAWTPELIDDAAAAAAEHAIADVAEYPAAGYRRKLVASGLRRVLRELIGPAS
jgi:carbon-monoxide dehydrogenase medium subunit